MNIEEIKKNAPDGATHYVRYKHFIHYLKRIGFVYVIYRERKWAMCSSHFLEKYNVDIKPL